MSPQRREKLVELSRKYNFLVRPYPPLQSHL